VSKLNEDKRQALVDLYNRLRKTELVPLLGKSASPRATDEGVSKVCAMKFPLSLVIYFVFQPTVENLSQTIQYLSSGKGFLRSPKRYVLKYMIALPSQIVRNCE